MNPAQPPFIIRPVRRGQPISGAHLSKLSEGLNRMNAGCAPPRQIFPQASPSQQVAADVVAVVAATTENQDTTDVSIIDGVTLTDGDWVFLQNQDTDSKNGVYTFNATDGTLAGQSQPYGVLVTDGTANGQTLWALSEVTANKYNQVGENRKLYVISVQADYLTCNTESDGSGTTHYVAKPPRLRSTDTAARAVAGQTYTVTKSGFTTGVASGDAQTCTATRSSDSGTDTLEVVEPYLAGDEICALPYGDTYLDDPDGNAITLLDANVDARHWAVKASS